MPPREGDLVRRRPAESWHTRRGRDRSRIWADLPSIPVAVRIIVSPLRRRRNKRCPDGCLRERKPRISTSLRWNVFAGLPSLPVDQGPVGYDRPGGYSSFIRTSRQIAGTGRAPQGSRIAFMRPGAPRRKPPNSAPTGRIAVGGDGAGGNIAPVTDYHRRALPHIRRTPRGIRPDPRHISWTIGFFPLARPRESPGLHQPGFSFRKAALCRRQAPP